LRQIGRLPLVYLWAFAAPLSGRIARLELIGTHHHCHLAEDTPFSIQTQTSDLA
jgi:hypothetical protein